MTFDRTTAGWYSSAISERAEAFGQGDPARIVAVAFARFLSERGVQFDWSADDPLRMTVGGYWSLVVAATTETGDSITPDPTPDVWTLYGNTSIPGLVVLMGMTYRIETFRTNQLLDLDSFLKGVIPLAA